MAVPVTSTRSATALFVAVEGPTGAGKSTLAGRLATALDAILVSDPFEDNPFLALLLTSIQPTEALALRVEVTFLALRVAQLRQVGDLLAAGRSVVADWALLKQPIFAAGTLPSADAARISACTQVWAEALPSPDVLIGLSGPPAVLLQRVRDRGRAMESTLATGALARLSKAFESAYERWPAALFRRDAASFDALDDRHLTELVAEIGQFTTLMEVP